MFASDDGAVMERIVEVTRNPSPPDEWVDR